MKDFTVTAHNLQEFVNELQKELQESGALLVNTVDPRIGKWGLTRLWRSWIGSVAQWMADNGATMPLVIKKDGKCYGSRPFSADDAHELFTGHFMGTDENGKRLSWSRSGRDGARAATKAERYNAMRKLEQYAIERGIIIMKPIDSEYSRLEEQENS